MENFREFQGKDLEDTLSQAASELDRPRDQIEYEVVSEGRKGWFLGMGSRGFRIRVRLSRPASYETPPEDGLVEMVESLVKELLNGLQLEMDSRVWLEEDQVRVNLSGSDREFLLDPKGEILGALQFLLTRITRRRVTEPIRIHVDSDGFRVRREEEIVRMARRAAERVQRDREPERLPPLNPYERRLVHISLREVSGITTRSLGDGFFKRVSILPARDGGFGGRDFRESGRRPSGTNPRRRRFNGP